MTNRRLSLPAALLVVAVSLLIAPSSGSGGLAQASAAGVLPTGAVGTFAAGDNPTAVAVQGNYAYLTNYCGIYCYGPLDVIDVSNPAQPTLVGSTPSSWGTAGIAVQGSFAYTTGYYANPNYLRVMDISQPTTPFTAAAFTLTGVHPQAVAVQGSYAYMIDYGSSKLQVIDVSNPAASAFSACENTSPNSLPLLGSVSTDTGPSSVAVQGQDAYVVNAVSGSLQVIDVSNPASPAVIGSASLGSGGTSGTSYSGVALQGSYAYVADYNTNTLQVIDVSNPASPSLVASVPAGANPDAVYVAGHYAFVTNKSDSTLQVFDIAAPASPASLGTVPTGASPDSVFVSGQYAYVSNYAGGTLQIFDMSGLGLAAGSFSPPLPPVDPPADQCGGPGPGNGWFWPPPVVSPPAAHSVGGGPPNSSLLPASVVSPPVEQGVGNITILSLQVTGRVVTLAVQVPAAGKLMVSGSDIRPVTRRLGGSARIKIKLVLAKAAMASSSRRHKHHQRPRVSLKAAFKPTSGSSSLATVTITLA
jgi:hypothetical protein